MTTTTAMTATGTVAHNRLRKVLISFCAFVHGTLHRIRKLNPNPSDAQLLLSVRCRFDLDRMNNESHRISEKMPILCYSLHCTQNSSVDLFSSVQHPGQSILKIYPEKIGIRCRALLFNRVRARTNTHSVRSIYEIPCTQLQKRLKSHTTY